MSIMLCLGIATYSVMPYEAGQYLNKIQCFCFEEQRLNPNEEVDMPVFFYIDPAYAEDPRLENVDNIVLSYTFFQAKDGMELPVVQHSSNVSPNVSPNVPSSVSPNVSPNVPSSVPSNVSSTVSVR